MSCECLLLISHLYLSHGATTFIVYWLEASYWSFERNELKPCWQCLFLLNWLPPSIHPSITCAISRSYILFILWRKFLYDMTCSSLSTVKKDTSLINLSGVSKGWYRCRECGSDLETMLVIRIVIWTTLVLQTVHCPMEQTKRENEDLS